MHSLIIPKKIKCCIILRNDTYFFWIFLLLKILITNVQDFKSGPETFNSNYNHIDCIFPLFFSIKKRTTNLDDILIIISLPSRPYMHF